MKRIAHILIGLSLLALILALPAYLSRRDVQVQARLVTLAEKVTGFARAQGPQAFDFPADHGPHPDYQTEWWYYTGNLATIDGRHFGYQLTFFRRALVPPDQREARASEWAADQVFMAHFAVTDVAEKRHQAFERFSRGAAGLAGAQAMPYRTWLEDWRVEEIEPDIYRLRASEDGLTLDVHLTDEKGPVLQGDRGYSQKGPAPDNASYYYSLTRLASSGTVQVKDVSYQVSGWSWMDHEYSTSALAPDQVGWDWFALQLDDGSEWMVFHIRKADGSIDPFSSGTLVAPDGSTRHFNHDEFDIRVKDRWRSPRSDATYPAQWTMQVPTANLMLEIEPYLSDQELNVSYTYWEGAVHLTGEHAGRTVQGSGYIEMTGYASSMQGQF